MECLRGWVEVEALVGLGVPQRSYLNRFIMALSSHYGRWTRILCTGTLNPWMHRCAARTKVM